MLSDEEFFKEESEEEYSPRKKSKDSDSDFVPDDESDEDWGARKKTKVAPPVRSGRGRVRIHNFSPICFPIFIQLVSPNSVNLMSRFWGDNPTRVQ